MICARCDKPILRGQASTTYPVDSGSAAGADITVHADLCAIPDHQTAPERGTSAYWWSAASRRR